MSIMVGKIQHLVQEAERLYLNNTQEAEESQ